jgi:hypothetical protein
MLPAAFAVKAAALSEGVYFPGLARDENFLVAKIECAAEATAPPALLAAFFI